MTIEEDIKNCEKEIHGLEGAVDEKQNTVVSSLMISF